VHSAALSLPLNEAFGLPLGADKNRISSLSYDLRQKVGGSNEALDRLADIDDVNEIPLPKDVGLHLGVPAADPMPEMNARLDQVLNLD
jgi:hypothetical protein